MGLVSVGDVVVRFNLAGSSFTHGRTSSLTAEVRSLFTTNVGLFSQYRSGLPLTNTHNVRSASLTFHVPNAGVMHGMAGYFEATLYHGVELSIHPHRKDLSSKDMLSWFPLFFPLKVDLSSSSQNRIYSPFV
jgi:hypothetical protein